MKWYTTLNTIKSFYPCVDGWCKLLKHLGKTKADDEPVHILTIFESNGWEDTRWAFKCLDGVDKELQLFAVDCAEHVLPYFEDAYPEDNRPRKAIQVVRDYVNATNAADWAVAWADATDAAADAAANATANAVAWAVANAVVDARAAVDAAVDAVDAAVANAVDAAVADAADWDAAMSAMNAMNAEKVWQIERFKYYVNGEGK